MVEDLLALSDGFLGALTATGVPKLRSVFSADSFSQKRLSSVPSPAPYRQNANGVNTQECFRYAKGTSTTVGHIVRGTFSRRRNCTTRYLSLTELTHRSKNRKNDCVPCSLIGAIPFLSFFVVSSNNARHRRHHSRLSQEFNTYFKTKNGEAISQVAPVFKRSVFSDDRGEASTFRGDGSRCTPGVMFAAREPVGRLQPRLVRLAVFTAQTTKAGRAARCNDPHRCPERGKAARTSSFPQ